MLAARSLAAAWLALGALTAAAGPVQPGQLLPVLQLRDQHDRDWRVPADTRLLLFAADRKASNLAMAVLGSQPKGFLVARHAVYLADMSRMPGFVTRAFALPALREQAFEVGVSLDESALAGWPRQEGAVARDAHRPRDDGHPVESRPGVVTPPGAGPPPVSVHGLGRIHEKRQETSHENDR